MYTHVLKNVLGKDFRDQVKMRKGISSTIYKNRMILVNNFIGTIISKIKYRGLKGSWRLGYVLHILWDLSGFLDQIQSHLFLSSPQKFLTQSST